MNGTIARFLQPITGYILIGILIFNMTQRSHLSHGEKKRFASLYFAGIILGLFVCMIVIARFRLPDYWLLPTFALFSFLIYRFRGRLFPFRRYCAYCSKPLPLKRILYFDSNKCESCDPTEEDADTQKGTNSDENTDSEG